MRRSGIFFAVILAHLLMNIMFFWGTVGDVRAIAQFMIYGGMLSIIWHADFREKEAEPEPVDDTPEPPSAGPEPRIGDMLGAAISAED